MFGGLEAKLLAAKTRTHRVPRPGETSNIAIAVNDRSIFGSKRISVENVSVVIQHRSVSADLESKCQTAVGDDIKLACNDEDLYVRCDIADVRGCP